MQSLLEHIPSCLCCPGLFDCNLINSGVISYTKISSLLFAHELCRPVLAVKISPYFGGSRKRSISLHAIFFSTLFHLTTDIREVGLKNECNSRSLESHKHSHQWLLWAINFVKSQHGAKTLVPC